jgi:5-methylcytosine-specific restriction endonuclease McrA
LAQKKKRIRLSPEDYKKLKKEILDRDEWRCRICRSRTNLSVDHIIKRSQGGDDAGENLWTLCHECHRRKDERKLTLAEQWKIPPGTRRGEETSFMWKKEPVDE